MAGARLGRKRKSPKDWASEYEDLEVKKKKTSNEGDSETLVCKYCLFEINIIGTGKKPWDRVHEHLASNCHAKTKENYMSTAAFHQPKACNSTTLAFVLARVLTEIGKEWVDVIGLVSDSTNYMNKLYNDLKPHNHKFVT